MDRSGIDIHIPFAEHLGVRLLSQGDGRAEIELALKDEHHNSWGKAHGGVLLSLLDIVMGLGARSLDTGSTGAVTIELKTNFLRIAEGTLRASSCATRIGKNLIYVEGHISGDNGDDVAKATGTFKLNYPKESRT